MVAVSSHSRHWEDDRYETKHLAIGRRGQSDQWPRGTRNAVGYRCAQRGNARIRSIGIVKRHDGRLEHDASWLPTRFDAARAVVIMCREKIPSSDSSARGIVESPHRQLTYRFKNCRYNARNADDPRVIKRRSFTATKFRKSQSIFFPIIRIR